MWLSPQNAKQFQNVMRQLVTRSTARFLSWFQGFKIGWALKGLTCRCAPSLHVIPTSCICYVMFNLLSFGTRLTIIYNYYWLLLYVFLLIFKDYVFHFCTYLTGQLFVAFLTEHLGHLRPEPAVFSNHHHFTHFVPHALWGWMSWYVMICYVISYFPFVENGRWWCLLNWQTSSMWNNYSFCCFMFFPEVSNILTNKHDQTIKQIVSEVSNWLNKRDQAIKNLGLWTSTSVRSIGA